MNKDKFRGKIIGSNIGREELDWAYGDRVEELSTGRIFICDLSHFDERTLLKDVLIEVDPTTVGQYTGLRDKNGKEIYEGDIISVQFEVDREPEYGEPPKWYENFGVAFDEVHHCWSTKISESEYGEWLYEYDEDCAKVIGSIHDNPELLN